MQKNTKDTLIVFAIVIVALFGDYIFDHIFNF